MAQYNIISEYDPHSSVTEQYRKLRTNIDYSNLDKEIKVINLTSTYPGEGKTVTTLNLATVYSQTKQKTLLIDLDLRKPKMHRAFQLPNKGGVSGYVLNEHPIQDEIQTIHDHLDILVAGEKVPFPAEVLVSNKIKKMFEELRGMYDRIIIDCPPMTAVADATIISNYCDATMFVIASRHTNRDVAKGCIKDLKENGGNIIGAVLTRVQRRDQYYGMEYYYYYGNE
ncbi:CpsD/CapB family tyrosine-protein kinase [Candidatus Xianfuyuplasma coldseepsis]|uniref:non-specific protein-tyrosine kinase n=1 Tax=Candidatus Xianfuyuplasma coldseepsis TaxID=2782163 RepID=A0A7L7KPF4_9MOLU|nr:CpsD/CapB family tyrosine-protein kinase [Xianfuyuplasma coldseepsis]QMS84537.1 CpsD/CapB family tyrosine-protein kinase [Xianfuyuplasma coldseepsis]